MVIIEYPFEVLIQNDDAVGIGELQIGSWTIGNNYQEDLLIFRKSDGINTPQVAAVIESGSVGYHVTCMCSASKMSVWIDGEEKVSTTDTTVKQTQNTTNLYIGSQGEKHNYYSGSIANLMIFKGSKTAEQIAYEVGSVMNVPVIEYETDPSNITNVKNQTKSYNFSISTLKFRKAFKFKFKETVESITESLVNNWDTMKKTDRSEPYYYE